MKNANDQSTFEQLSKTLDEEERKVLLEKLRKDRKVQDYSGQEGDQKRETNVQRQLKIAESTYKAMGFFSKFFILLATFFTGRKKEEIILDRLFEDIKRKIIFVNSGMVDFKNNVLTNNFVAEILKLAELCNSGIKVVDEFFGDQYFYNGFISSIVEENLGEDIRNSLDTLKPENYKIKSDFVEEKDYFRDKENKIRSFFDKLSLVSFSEMNIKFLCLELIIRLITFDFKTLFYEISKNSTDLNGHYIGIKFFTIANLCEKLFVLINTIDFGYEDISFIEKINGFIQNNHDTMIGKKNMLAENDLSLLKGIFVLIEDIKHKIPFKEIYQYFKRDLLYKPMNLKLKFDSIQIYKDFKRNDINLSWEENLKTIKELNLRKLINNLFKDYNYYTLKNFNLELKKEVDRHSIVKLMYVKKINIIVNFIEKIYKKEAEKILHRILIEGNFNKESDRSNFTGTYYQLYNCMESIAKYDNNFDPLNEFGKKISTFIKISTSDAEFTYSLKNIIIDINASSKEILDDVFSSIQAINTLVGNLSKHYELSKPILNNYENIKIPGYISLLNSMQKIKGYFDQFFKIYDLIED